MSNIGGDSNNVLSLRDDTSHRKLPNGDNLDSEDDMNDRLTKLETQVETLKDNVATKEDIANMKGDLGKDIANMKGDLGKEIAKMNGDLGKEIAQMNGNLGKEIAQMNGELGKKIVKIETEIKNLAPKPWILGGVIAGIVTLIFIGSRFIPLP